MDIDEALRLLKGGEAGVAEWNERRKTDESIPSLIRANLTGVALDGADLSDCNLTAADLQACSLVGADLRRADLSGATLAGADLSCIDPSHGDDDISLRSNLSHARLLQANLSGADLTGATLAGADMRCCDLSGSQIAEACLRGANLVEANLSLANLHLADLSNANLVQAILTGTNLEWADLSRANIYQPGGRKLWNVVIPLNRFPFRLNNTRIERTRFSPWASDPWSVLRRTYTGAMLLFHLVFLIAFFLPYVARTMFWLSVHHLEQTVIRQTTPMLKVTPEGGDQSQKSVSRRQTTLDRPFSSEMPDGRIIPTNSFFPEPGAAQQDSPECLDQTLAPVSVRARVTGLISSAGNSVRVRDQMDQIELRTRPVWHLLLGLDNGVFSFLLVIALLAYNLGRCTLTYFVSRLREQEERSGVSPAWRDYQWLYRLHQVVAPLLFVAVVSFLFNAWSWLNAPVILLK